jgi:DNA invertase Pin-like site-specific DNA recombinase
MAMHSYNVPMQAKAALYARVSTSLKYDRQDPATQLLPLRDFCLKRGWEISRQYVDDISAVKRRRAYDELMADARRGRDYSIIVVVRLDRIFRSVEEFVSTARRLDQWGIRFVCTDQPIDTDHNDPAGRLLMTIIAAVAEFERALISERVKAGIARVRAQGKAWGGRQRKKIDVGEARQLQDQGWSLTKISGLLNCNRNLLSKRLRDEQR